MKKDFNAWNVQKQIIHGRPEAPFYHEREIWWCSLGVNIGFEQDGSGTEYRRPVLVLRGVSRETCFIIPLTTAQKDHPLRPSIGEIDGKKARALLSQMRLIDTRRLVRKIAHLDLHTFERIRNAARGLL